MDGEGACPSPWSTPADLQERLWCSIGAPEFVKELARNPKAKQFYATLDKANLYSIAYRLQTAKRPETKIKRIKLIIEMLARGGKFH